MDAHDEQHEKAKKTKSIYNMEENEKKAIGLPENAFRELKPGEKYEPVLRSDCNYPEVTPYSVSLGLVMAVIFSAAAAFLGLKVGRCSRRLFLLPLLPWDCRTQCAERAHLART